MRIKHEVFGTTKLCLDELKERQKDFSKDVKFSKLEFRVVTLPQIAIRWCDPDSNIYNIIRSSIEAFPECSPIHIAMNPIEIEYDNLSGESKNGLGTSDDIFNDSNRILGTIKTAYKTSLISEMIANRVREKKSGLTTVVDEIDKLYPGTKDNILDSSCFIGALDGLIKTATKQCEEKKESANDISVEHLNQMKDILDTEIEHFQCIGDECAEYISFGQKACYFYISFHNMSIADLKEKLEKASSRMQDQLDSFMIGYSGLHGDLELLHELLKAIDELANELNTPKTN